MKHGFKTLYFIRIFYLVGALVFCWYQFLTPWYQYSQDKTSILTQVNEPSRDRYPSVTICTGLKDKNILDILDSDTIDELQPEDVSEYLDKNDWNFNQQDIIHGVYQEYYEQAPRCDRSWESGKNLVEDASLWTLSIPHAESAGKCFTYNPSYESAPGVCYALRIALGNYSNNASVEQMESVKIYLHEPGKFTFFTEPDKIPNNVKIDRLKLQKDAASTFILSKTKLISLSRSDRECEEKVDFNWGDCLDEEFYLKKGCQDPWHVNPKVPLPPCTNVTYIRASYDRGPARESYGGWDMQFWDRQYMAERELADLSRDGKRCMSPCSQTYYNLEPSYLPKDKVIKAEYGDKDEWVYAITFIYKTLLQEEREEYLVCDFPCLLSSAGGYVGLFFGVSIFDLIFTFEWIIIYLNSCRKKGK